MAINEYVAKFWPNFNEYVWPEVECGDGRSVAIKVLEEYGIPIASNSYNIGGPLDNVDIKHLDALTVIKTSLMDYSIENGGLYEPTVNPDGEVEFINLKDNNSADIDIYYTVQTQSYKEPCKGVMLTGGKPLPIRKPIEWIPIWGAPENKYIYDTFGMENNCNSPDFKTWATIVFKDPHMDDSSFENGIDNLYEITKENPFDKIIGYAYFIHHGNLANNDTNVAFQKQSKIMIQVGDGISEYGPNVGTLIRKEVIASAIEDCWYPVEEPKDTDGVEVVIPEKLRYERHRAKGTEEEEAVKIDTFLQISDVYVIGIELDLCRGTPIDAAASATGEKISTEENTRVWVMAADSSKKMLRLNPGDHYVAIYPEGEDGFKKARIAFANNARNGDNAHYGADTTYYYIAEGELWAKNAPRTYDIGTILPLGGVKGFLVKEIWVAADLDTPSFVITDPRGHARDIAEQIEVLVGPIVLTDPPAPIVFNGQLIDQSQNIFDNDPTTVQNLEDTQFEQALDIMSGGGLSLSFSYLSGKSDEEQSQIEEQLKTLSFELLDYMNDELGDIEATYACGPDSDPKLGDKAPAGTVNSITYSYNDSGSYTISVNAGPKIVGNFAELSQGVYFKQQADASGMQGTIIQDEGNNVVFKVKIDGYGDVYAINCGPNILRSGDIVACTIHNNPIGEV